mmetsp:Transcript_6044/g.22106  ORF Transcript_6044/g.22106 Transcript_6044/m.22106 type:complete len:216 (-) Transcript_6044:959-1606(-)
MNRSTGPSLASSRLDNAARVPPLAPISSTTAAITSGRPVASAASNASPTRNRRRALSYGFRRIRFRRAITICPSAAFSFVPRTKYCQLPASSRRGPLFFPPPTPTRPPTPPSPYAASLGTFLLRIDRSLFAHPTARTFASGDSATDNTGPGYLAACVTVKSSNSCTLTWPSRLPVSNRGADRAVAERRANDEPSGPPAIGGPPSGATWQHMIVFW